MMTMGTGDKILLLLLAKVACCFGLVLAATGALGGVGIWLLDGAGRWLLGAALIALIAVIVVGWSRRTATDALSESGEQGALRRLEHGR